MSLLLTHQNEFGSTDIGSVEVKTLSIQNYLGVKKDIRDIVGFLRISESIEMVGMILELGIKDESNFFELFEITGHEIIEVELVQKLFQDNKEIAKVLTAKVEFHVTDYPEYAKLDDNQVQTYTIVATTRALWLGPLKKISRAVNSDITDVIRQILVRDLQYPIKDISRSGQPKTRMNGILNWDTPLNHISRLKEYLADSLHTPYFIHEILSGGIVMHPLSSISEGMPYRTYWDQRKSLSEDPGSWETQLWNLSRIASLSSEMGLAQVVNATAGMYASEWHMIDPMQKTRYRKVFNRDRDIRVDQTFSGKRMRKPSKIGAEGRGMLPLTEMPESYMRYMFQNEFQDGGGALKREGINQIISANGPRLQSHYAALGTVSHEIDVPGDLNLNPGRVINLRLPKSTDPENLKSYAGTPVWDNDDHSLGGKYIVWGVVHNITSSGKYTSSMMARKDHI